MRFLVGWICQPRGLCVECFLREALLKRCGAEFLAYSDHKEFCPTLTAVEAVLLKGRSSILVMTESESGKWVIVGIDLDQKSQHFFHFIAGSYSSKHGAEFLVVNVLSSLPAAE